MQTTQQASGFVTGADDVVQPYALPKNFYASLNVSTTQLMSPQATSGAVTPAVNAEAEEWVDVSLIQQTNAHLPDGDDEASNDDMEEIIYLDPPDTREIAPKTMRELAEDAARAQQQVEKSEGAEVEMLVSKEPSKSQGRRSAIANTSNAAPGTTSPSVSTPSRSTAPRRKAPRTGKRARASSVTDSEEITQKKPSPSKRARRAAAPVPVSDRVLRTRLPKSAERVNEEKEMEEAIRKATRE